MIFITGPKAVSATSIWKSVKWRACRDEPRASLRARLAAIPLNRLVVFLDFDGTLTPSRETTPTFNGWESALVGEPTLFLWRSSRRNVFQVGGSPGPLRQMHNRKSV